LLERQGLSSPYTMPEDSRTLLLPQTPVINTQSVWWSSIRTSMRAWKWSNSLWAIVSTVT
jgi:hypothetical protein